MAIDTQDNRAAAIAYAQLGIDVFPCLHDPVPEGRKPKDPTYQVKIGQPHVFWTRPHGPSWSATSDRTAIAKHWPTKRGHDAVGGVVRHLIIDHDFPKDASLTLAERQSLFDARSDQLLRDFPELRTAPRVHTPHGGDHYQLEVPEGTPNMGAGKWPANSNPKAERAIDRPWGELRGSGKGYTLLPPAMIDGEAYEWSVPYGPLPTAGPALLAFLRAPRSTREGPAEGTPQRTDPEARAWALKALTSECKDVADTREGGRRNALNDAAFAVGQIVAGGYLTRDEAEDALTTAAAKMQQRKARDPFTDTEVRNTIAAGIDDGMRKPRHPAPPELGPPPRDATDAYASPAPDIEPPPDLADDLPSDPNDASVMVERKNTSAKPAAKPTKPTKPKPAVKPPKGKEPQLVKLANIDREHVERLDAEGRLNIGKTTILVGDPGAGKTFIALSFAANITCGRPALPNAISPNTIARAPANVLALIGEDGLGDTIRPRFEDAGGDVNRFFAMTGIMETRADGTTNERDVNLYDLEQIEAAVTRVNPLLVIVDPLTHFFGIGTDSNSGPEVRANLRGIVKMAERHRFALLILHHMNKGSGKAIYRGVGSIDLPAFARSYLVAGEYEGILGLAQSKSTTAAKAPTITYEITNDGLRWIGTSEATADDLTSARPSAVSAPKLIEAKEWLLRQLDGPRSLPQSEIKALLERDRVASWRTVNEAKKLAGVKSRWRSKDDGTRYWEWYLDDA